MIKNILKNILALLSGIAVALLIFEIFLRIYNPIPVRIKGGDIVLPVNRSYVIKNTTISKLDAEIKHTKNSLGFRGDEPPKDLENYLSIIVVGGSTAESYYISDNKTWPYLLEQSLKKSFPKVWINNAGFDGHSTFGHQILLDKYISRIKPKFTLLLVSINDVGRSDLNFGFDNRLLKNSYVSYVDFISKKSELANFTINILRSLKARRLGVGHSSVDLFKVDTMDIPNDRMGKMIAEQENYLESYEQRLLKIVNTSRENGIEPILVTQPTLWGEGRDPQTNIDLTMVKVDDKRNGKLYWEVLKLYNRKTEEVGKETGAFVIDLAQEMPKDSLYYYDGIHFSNEGSEKVAEIINEKLTPYLKNNSQ